MVIDLNASPLTGPNALIKAVLDRLFALVAACSTGTGTGVNCNINQA